MFLPDYSSLLSISNQLYADLVLQFWQFMVKLDFPDADPSRFFVEDKLVQVDFFSRESGVVAGLEELGVLNGMFSDLVFDFKLSDGDLLLQNSVFLTVKGSLSRVLMLERIILNFVARMSSITTHSKKYTDLLSGFKNPLKVLCTRKAMLGMLDKKAASLSGILTHRLNLSDAVMIKDNHYAGLDFENLDSGVFNKVKFIEFEVDSFDQLKRYLPKFELYFEKFKGGILLDNFTINDIEIAVDFLNAKKRNFFIEASGGINLLNLKNYDLKGLDAVSTSDVFNFVKCLDFSAEFVS